MARFEREQSEYVEKLVALNEELKKLPVCDWKGVKVVTSGAGAAAIAIVVAKAPFGGTGRNVFNPAAAGVALGWLVYGVVMFAVDRR